MKKNKNELKRTKNDIKEKLLYILFTIAFLLSFCPLYFISEQFSEKPFFSIISLIGLICLYAFAIYNYDKNIKNSNRYYLGNIPYVIKIYLSEITDDVTEEKIVDFVKQATDEKIRSNFSAEHYDLFYKYNGKKVDINSECFKTCFCETNKEKLYISHEYSLEIQLSKYNCIMGVSMHCHSIHCEDQISCCQNILDIITEFDEQQENKPTSEYCPDEDENTNDDWNW